MEYPLIKPVYLGGLPDLRNYVIGERYFFVKRYDSKGKPSPFLDKPLPVGQETYEGIRSGKLLEKKYTTYRGKFQGVEFTFIDIINNKGEPQEKASFIDLKNHNIYIMTPIETAAPQPTSGGFYRRHTRNNGTPTRRRKQNRRRGTCELRSRSKRCKKRFFTSVY